MKLSKNKLKQLIINEYKLIREKNNNIKMSPNEAMKFVKETLFNVFNDQYYTTFIKSASVSNYTDGNWEFEAKMLVPMSIINDNNIEFLENLRWNSSQGAGKIFSKSTISNGKRIKDSYYFIWWVRGGYDI